MKAESKTFDIAAKCPEVCNAATAVRIPRKKRIVGVSTLVSTWITEFSLSKSLSLFPEEFDKSIDSFINSVVENIKSQGVSFKEDELINKLKDYYCVSSIDT